MLLRRAVRSYATGRAPWTSVGDVGRATRTFTGADVDAFTKVSLDNNPLHHDEEFARSTRFGRCIVHGMLYASMFSAIIGQRTPGAVYLSQTLDFKLPVHVGDTVTAEIEVKRIAHGGRTLFFDTHCRNQDQELVLSGTARVLMPR
jgi:acyl dehydratase